MRYKDDAERILEGMRQRLKKFGLELSEDKTKIVGFGRFAVENAKRQNHRAVKSGTLKAGRG